MWARSIVRRAVPEQTTVGKFWFLTGARTYNPIVRQVVLAKQMNLLDCARIYALASMAAADSFIAVFEAKYHYNFWRPVTAIRNADLSQNPAHSARRRPGSRSERRRCIPNIPCAHCISASAVAAALRARGGRRGGRDQRHQQHGARRDAPLDAALRLRDEVSNARIWAGFHYRFSTEAGKEMGTKIGELTVATPAASVPERKK